MERQFQNSQLKDQYSTPQNVKARWDLYQYTLPKVNLHEEAIKTLALKGKETILEVGCGDGSILIKLKKSGHKGKLIGIDSNEKMFANSNQEGIEFLKETANKLPFPDNSIDIILAFFMLYHMPNIENTLKERDRVLKDNGKLIISTSSKDNRKKHEEYKQIISETKPFPKFSSKFNLENGKDKLKNIQSKRHSNL